MILTTCAACAAPLAHDHKKRCSRCKTRYCNEACQRDHWERGGHEALCRRIKRGGGAEQYHADKKYKEAVAVAVDRHGANHIETLKLRWRLATSLYKCEGASISDCEEAVATLEDVILISRRVCGTNHPTFAKAPIALESAREALARARARASKINLDA